MLCETLSSLALVAHALLLASSHGYLSGKSMPPAKAADGLDRAADVTHRLD